MRGPAVTRGTFFFYSGVLFGARRGFFGMPRVSRSWGCEFIFRLGRVGAAASFRRIAVDRVDVDCFGKLVRFGLLHSICKKTFRGVIGTRSWSLRGGISIDFRRERNRGL